MKYLFTSLKTLALLLLALGAFQFTAAEPVLAQEPSDCTQNQVYDTSNKTCYTKLDPGDLPTSKADKGAVNTAKDIVFGVVGALAFLMIVVSGLRYVLSAGNPEKSKKAREGVIYALIGLVIALSAWSIVTFVVNNL